MLDCAALSMGVLRRCFHGCFQKGSISAFMWIYSSTDLRLPAYPVLLEPYARFLLLLHRRLMLAPPPDQELAQAELGSRDGRGKSDQP